MTDTGIGLIADGVSHDAYVVGADWTLRIHKRDVTKHMRGAALGLAIAGDEGQVVSTLDKEFRADTIGNRNALLNAAALIAQVERNAVVFHELPDGRVWVAALRDGLPLPGCDRITPINAAHDMLGEFMTFVPNGRVIGTSVDAVRSTETVLRAADTKQRSLCTYRKPASLALLALKLMVVVAVIAAVVFAVQSLRVAREAAEQAHKAAMDKLNESARAEAAIAQYQEEVREAVEHARAEIAQSAPAQAQLASWLARISQQPLVHKGFRLEAASCTPDVCKFKWRALPHADLAGPTSAAADEIVEQRDDTSMVIAQPVPPVAKAARPREDRLQLVSRFHQRAGIPQVVFEINAQLLPVLAPMPPKPDLPPASLQKLSGLQAVTVARQAGVTLAAPLALVREAVALMGDSVTLTSLETGHLTSPTGGATAPLLKLTGQHVQLP